MAAIGERASPAAVTASTRCSWRRRGRSPTAAQHIKVDGDGADGLDTAGAGVYLAAKRSSAADSTPNAGGPRKDAPLTGIRARRRLIDLFEGDDADAATAAAQRL